MRVPTIIGIILIVAGVVALAFKGIRYKTMDTVIDAGPVKVQAEREKTLPLEPIAGIAAVLGGVVLVGLGRRHS
ncbi:MAG TPA: DUF3185 domain-containing protein [Pseudodesulfovibrio sp.]|nr:DUF3185 domain-containing protein [Pseudodesulfovibrio sp.]